MGFHWGCSLVNSTPKYISRIRPQNILAAGSLVLDSVPKQFVRGIEYLLDISNASGTIKKTIKVNGHHDDSSADETRYGVLGNMNATYSLDLNGSNLELTVTNNELFTLSVTALRTLLPA